LIHFYKREIVRVITMSSSRAAVAIVYVIFAIVFPAVKALGVDLESVEAEDGEERTIFTSGGTYYVALNTTYLLIWSLLLGALLLGALFLSGTAGASSDSGYSGYSGYQQRQDHQGHHGHNRQRRQDYDFTEQLNRLAEAFHKYEIDEAQGCQLYVACESSNVGQHYKNGPLAKTVYTVMRTIAAPENSHLYEDDKYLQDILQAFKAGASGEACDSFRKQCRKDKVFG